MKKALVLSLILAVGIGLVGFGQTLGGKWDTFIKFTGTPLAWPPVITSALTVNYKVCDWTFTSYTAIDTSVLPIWKTQYFSAAGVLGAFTLGSKLEFTPDPAAFTKWTSTASVSIAGVTFGAEFILTPGVTKLTLTATGTAGICTIGGKLILGSGLGCDFDFNGVELTFGFPFCCATISSKVVFGCTGFNYVQFCTTGITIANIPWLTLDACVKFETQTKTVTLSPKINLGVVGCDFDIFARFVSSGGVNAPLLISDFVIDGIQIACDIDGVSFVGITYWGPAPKPGILVGTEYWEAYQIKTTDDGCCGPFSFDVAVFFKDTATTLFDISLFKANMGITLASQFKFKMSLALDVDAGALSELGFGFEVTW